MIETDEDWFFSSSGKNFTYTTFVETQSSSGIYAMLYVRVTPSYTLSTRIYKKIPDVLAQMVSVVNLLHFVVVFFLRYYNRISLNASLINQYFFEDNKNSKKEKIRNSLLVLKTNNLANNSARQSMVNNFLNEENSKKLFNKLTNNIFELNPETLKFNQPKILPTLTPTKLNARKISNTQSKYVHTSLIFFSICCRRYKMLPLYKTIGSRIENKMEVTSYLDDLEEIKYLKQICLSQVQQDLLTALTNHQVFKHGDEKNSDWLKCNERDEATILDSLKLFYEIPDNELSKKDEKFMNLLRKKILI